jgi:tRNA(Leu) C34 or U34 (ribose-2'-O)-methylase TrmL
MDGTLSRTLFYLADVGKGVRSLNLGSSVAVAVYDGLRQLNKF